MKIRNNILGVTTVNDIIFIIGRNECMVSVQVLRDCSGASPTPVNQRTKALDSTHTFFDENTFTCRKHLGETT